MKSPNLGSFPSILIRRDKTSISFVRPKNINIKSNSNFVRYLAVKFLLSHSPVNVNEGEGHLG